MSARLEDLMQTIQSLQPGADVMDWESTANTVYVIPPSRRHPTVSTSTPSPVRGGVRIQPVGLIGTTMAFVGAVAAALAPEGKNPGVFEKGVKGEQNGDDHLPGLEGGQPPGGGVGGNGIGYPGLGAPQAQADDEKESESSQDSENG